MSWRLWLAVVVLAHACSAPARPTSTTSGTDHGRAGVNAAATRQRPVAIKPPVAARRPHEIKSPHGTRIDPYYWLRDDTRASPEVLAYLEAENAYAAAVLAPAKPIEDAIVAETVARIADGDVDAPMLDDGYWYYGRFEPGKDHPIYARRKGTMTAAEEILLDGNELARGHPFYAIGDYAVSPNGELLAWTEDVVGRNQFKLRVKDLATGTQAGAVAQDIAPMVAWANDNRTLFYVGKDPTTLREDRVMRHALGGAHELVYREQDAAYYVGIAKTKSRRYIRIQLDATTMSETRLIDANKPTAQPRVFIPRAEDHVYDVDHLGNRFVVRTNDSGADNFQLVEVPATKPDRRRGWKPLVKHRADVLIEAFVLYDTFIALDVRVGGLSRIEVHAGKRKPFYLVGDDPTYVMSLIDTPDARTTQLRYSYDSLTTPSATYEHDVATGKRTLLHREPAPTYDPTRYRSEYRHATAKDGTKVPVSIVSRADTKRDGTAPLLVVGYGAYGDSMEPTFERTRVSLLDRGWVFAIAHVRGGQELGDHWYEAGRVLAKQNTFTDFIAVTEFLVAEQYGAKDRVFAEGASAGGLLIGVIANLRPDLYRGLVAWVPFVDAVTTMLDESIPLVTNEYEEWGDPRDKRAYDYILAYSPYDNVRAQRYPAMYVRTGLHDSQVQYYEPAKWVAKLRATKTDDHPLVFETDMTAGHAGKPGRFGAVREQARAYAFMLHVLGDRR